MQDPGTVVSRNDMTCKHSNEKAVTEHKKDASVSHHVGSRVPWIRRLMQRMKALLGGPCGKLHEEVLDDFQRTLQIVRRMPSGSDSGLVYAQGLFDTGTSSDNLISKSFVLDQDLHNIQWHEENAEPQPLIAFNSEVRVVGELTARWRGMDKACKGKGIFLAPKFYKTRFLVVEMNKEKIPFDVIICLRTMHDLHLFKKHIFPGFRPPKPAFDREKTREAWKAQQAEKKCQEEIKQAREAAAKPAEQKSNLAKH